MAAVKKIYTLAALVLVALVFLFAVVSFLRENWTADQTPSAVERLLARWVLGRARAPQAQEKNPFPATEENWAEGRQHYEQQCAFCHGLDGEGPGASGIQFYPPVPSLVVQQSELTDAQMHFIISRGIRYTAMPSFAKVLTDEQIWKTVLWLRRLPRQRDPSPAGPAPSERPPSPASPL